MTGLRVWLVAEARGAGAAVQAALGTGDRLVSDGGTADVVVLRSDSGGSVESVDLEGTRAFVVALSEAADATLDPRVDAVWLEPLVPDDGHAIIEDARACARDRAERSLEIIVELERARCDALQAILAREETVLFEAHAAADLALNPAFVEIREDAAFAEVVRHAERRALRTGIRALVLALDAAEVAPFVGLLSADDVLLRRSDGGAKMLLCDASDDVIAQACRELGERAALVPAER